MQDLWIKKVMAKESKGRVLFRRYADDSIVCFERKDDAEAYLRELPGRLAKFGLELADEKSALVKFNRWEPETSGKFTFLGFDFYWAKTPAQSEAPGGEAQHQRQEVPCRVWPRSRNG